MHYPFFEIGDLDPAEENKILNEIGVSLVEAAPENWERIVYIRRMVIEKGTETLTVEFPDGTSERIFSPAKILPLLSRLRMGMHLEDETTEPSHPDDTRPLLTPRPQRQGHGHRYRCRKPATGHTPGQSRSRAGSRAADPFSLLLNCSQTQHPDLCRTRLVSDHETY